MLNSQVIDVRTNDYSKSEFLDQVLLKDTNSAIVNSIDYPILFINNKFDIVFINHASDILFCSQKMNLIGINIGDFPSFSALSGALFKSIYSKLKTINRSYPTIKWIKSISNPWEISKDYYSIKATGIYHESTFLGFSLTILDITQQIRTKLSLCINKSLNKGILDLGSDSIFTLDSKMLLISMNASARKLLINPSCDYIGSKLEKIIQIKNPHSSIKLVSEALAKQKHNKYLEIIVSDTSGNEYCFEVSIGVIEQSIYTLYTAVFRNISSQKQNENQLNLALAGENKQDKAKSSFLAVMSHEIRTPLIGILGIHEILQDTNLNEEQTRYLDIANKSSRTLINMINGILDFSKIEAGKLEIEMISFNLEDMINQVIEILATSAFKKGISLQTYIDPKLPLEIISDPVRLNQILMNLVNNAIKFTDNGGVSVSVLYSEQNFNQIVFEVKDSGIGIPSNKLNTIFDDFIQVESSTHRRFGGTGLGLAISNRLANLLGGKLTLSSKLDIGSTFQFTLGPLESKSSVYPIPSELTGINLLLVDNSLMSSSTLLRQLKSFSMAVTHVNTLNHALEYLAGDDSCRHSYQIVIVNLYQLDGDLNQFCSSLGQSIVNDKSCFILIGLSNEIRQTKAYHETVFTSAIPLPVRRETLVQRIKLLLDKGMDDYVPSSKIVELVSLHQNNITILVVDDVSTNRIVTESMLKHAGYNTYSAKNGEEAISVLHQHGNIDLVLMDLSMPVMDGVEATIFIRTLPNLKTLPIIAMTATVLQEEIDACYKAGMNDYLAKPFTKQALFNKLTEWTSTLAMNGDSQTINRVEKNTVALGSIEEIKLTDDSKYIDKDVLSEMSEGLPAGMIKEMLELFISESEKHLELIKQLLKNKDTVELGNQSHALRGSSATFGAGLLRSLTEELELCCKQGSAENIDPLTLQVLDIGRKTMDAYRAISISNKT